MQHQGRNRHSSIHPTDYSQAATGQGKNPQSLIHRTTHSKATHILGPEFARNLKTIGSCSRAGDMAPQFLKSGQKQQCLEANLPVCVPNVRINRCNSLH
jgi:hypothetical protein